MNRLDCLRAGEIQALVVTLQLFITPKKRTIVVVLFSESVFLDHSAHRTVQDKYLSVKNHITKVRIIPGNSAEFRLQLPIRSLLPH